MVAVTALKVISHVRTQGISLILSLFLQHVVPLEDIAVELRSGSLLQTKPAFGTRSQILRDHDIVKEIPCIAVSQRSESRLEHIGKGIVEIARLEIRHLGFGTQTLGNALVRRIVVEVAHGYDLGRRVDVQHGIRNAAHLLPDGNALEFRSVLAAQPRRPVSSILPHIVRMSRVLKLGSCGTTVFTGKLPSSLNTSGRYMKATSTPRASGES